MWKSNCLLILGQINDWCREDQQSTFSFAWKGDHLCWSWGVGADQRSMQRGSTVNVERVKSLSHEKAIACVDPGGQLMINVERINSQLSLSREKAIASVDPPGGDDRQSTWRGSTVNLHFRKKRLSPPLIGGEDAPLKHAVCSTGWPLVVFKWRKW